MAVYFHNTITELTKALGPIDGPGFFVLSDEQVAAHWKSTIFDQTPHHLLHPGESAKTLTEVEKTAEKMMMVGLNRTGKLINVGGGLVCDLGGLTASIYTRGIPFIQIPTSLLAMVDASVGGKTGVNLAGVKNYLGTFTEPHSVHICPEFLSTLPLRELKSGKAEMLKHALLKSENATLNFIEHIETMPTLDSIKESVAFKDAVVREDFKENGLRKILNLGHTVGHALESYSQKYLKEPITHGEAVALGMVVELQLSINKYQFPSDVFKKIKTAVYNYWFEKNWPNFTQQRENVLEELLLKDKKNTHAIQAVLLKKPGDPILSEISKEEIVAEIKNCFA